ncbi:MAG: cupin domain-containing protein [Patescibacteria group bacterium]
MKLTRKQTVHKNKFGADLRVYKINRKDAGLAYIEVKKGHFEEFMNRKSTFIYYVLHGKGTFYLNGKSTTVKATDVVVIPPKTKAYYLGHMKLVLVTVPAWQAKYEKHVRLIK